MLQLWCVLQSGCVLNPALDYTCSTSRVQDNYGIEQLRVMTHESNSKSLDIKVSSKIILTNETKEQNMCVFFDETKYVLD